MNITYYISSLAAFTGGGTTVYIQLLRNLEVKKE